MQELLTNADALHFIAEAYKHCKPIGGDNEGVQLIQQSLGKDKAKGAGVITSGDLDEFIHAVKQHRFWDREENPGIPA